jgi:hypothetical protein
MTLNKILQIEPRLKTILDKAKNMQPINENYTMLKQMIEPLVGFGAEKEELKNHRCYEIINFSLYKLLKY